MPGKTGIVCALMVCPAGGLIRINNNRPSFIKFGCGMDPDIAFRSRLPSFFMEDEQDCLISLGIVLFTLALGIAIQNFPEGAIVSMPLRSEGMPKGKTFLYGVISGAVEPVAAWVTILAAGVIVPVMPYLLSFAAGAMLYVVVEELIPEMSEGEHNNIGTISFSLGFVLMMILDVALG